MSDIGSDLDAAIELVRKAEDRLNLKDPKHELIAYLFIKNENEHEAAWQILLKKFSKEPQAAGNMKGSMAVTYALVNYLIALEVALGERPPS